MHRGKVADALLPQILTEQEADVAIISEQYKRRTNGYWFEDDTATAAIWIPSASNIHPKASGKGNCFVWTQLEDITLVSCYLTPSDGIEEFRERLDEIEDKIRQFEGNLIVAGDFNARAMEWGMPTTNSKGRKIVEMIARVGLTVANVGNIPTFRRAGCQGTIPDITLVSERISNRLTNWRVLEIYTASDHQYISYSFEERNTTTEGIRQQRASVRKWNVGKLDRSALIREIDRRIECVQTTNDATITVEKTMNIIKQACNKSMPKINHGNVKKKPVYWWNEEIANARRECLRDRRKYTRARRRGDAENERTTYKEAKKKLQLTIFKSKKQLWEDLREDINQNPWGTGYKIVMGKLGARIPTAPMETEDMEKIVTTLFPRNQIPMDRTHTDEIIHIPLFTEQELTVAANKLKSNKAPGPDGIPAEVIKEIAVKRPEIFLNMYNRCLQEGVFPRVWKEQRLVLISKGKGDPKSPSSYRPLCMLDTAGKLLERLIKPRLHEAIVAGGGLSERQHGFRPGRSTIGALKDVTDVVEAVQQATPSRSIVLLATLDVKNAFNSLRWTDILKALEDNFCVSEYLLRMIRNYLKDRKLIYYTKTGQRETSVTGGAAQGSILGPDLWNITYNEILKIEMPSDTFLVGYADDIAAVIKGRNVEEVTRRLRQVMIRAKSWLCTHGLQLATHKTEVVLLTRRHIPLEINIQIDDTTITTKRVLNYLGIKLDSKLKYVYQIEHATQKAVKITAQLSRLMANIGGPLPSRRKLLLEASTSILLYGCEIWGEQMKIQKRANALLAVQRTAALRITSAYRTVSAAAVLVIAGMIPIDLTIIERREVWLQNRANEVEPRAADTIRQQTFQKWQERWEANTNGRWTARLIPNIQRWITRKHGEVNYYLTQMLSGHGYFRKFLFKIGKCSSPFCLYENEKEIDDAEHTFFKCTRWLEKRRETENVTGMLTVENIVDTITTDETRWRAVAKFCEEILRTKKRDMDAAE